MGIDISNSRYADYDLRYLRKLLNDIDPHDDPEFYDEIQALIYVKDRDKTLAVGKEFGQLAQEIKHPDYVKSKSDKPLPGAKNRGYRSGGWFLY